MCIQSILKGKFVYRHHNIYQLPEPANVRPSHHTHLHWIIIFFFSVSYWHHSVCVCVCSCLNSFYHIQCITIYISFSFLHNFRDKRNWFELMRCCNFFSVVVVLAIPLSVASNLKSSEWEGNTSHTHHTSWVQKICSRTIDVHCVIVYGGEQNKTGNKSVDALHSLAWQFSEICTINQWVSKPVRNVHSRLVITLLLASIGARAAFSLLLHNKHVLLVQQRWLTYDSDIQYTTMQLNELLIAISPAVHFRSDAEPMNKARRWSYSYPLPDKIDSFGLHYPKD